MAPTSEAEDDLERVWRIIERRILSGETVASVHGPAARGERRGGRR